MTAPERQNRLADAASPYLIQHATNPVEWFPWGEEALQLARERNLPIFLSIGYAACHWCHVMAHESFEDSGVAAFLADHFVSIKVDREERPDIDAVYMAAVQMLTGSGGWPLTVFLTPDLEPFFGGTYFPPRERWGQPAFMDVLHAVAEAWATRRGEILRGAAEIRERLAAFATAAPADIDPAALAQRVLGALARDHDQKWGGFGTAPKFPTPSRLRFLIAQAADGSELAGRLLETTLDGMAAGGLRDWLGGGFHRYSVDARWLVPHFERMLYDNALLARTYAEAGVRLGVPRWVETARETADWMLTEMRDGEGAFYSSSDADTEGIEGLTFTWTPEEVRASLPPREAEAIIALCGLDGPPNFEGGRFVLRPSMLPDALAAKLACSPAEAAALVEAARAHLRAARSARVAPAIDDKRLAGWNGMAVWALAWLGATLEVPDYVGAAQAAGRFLLSRMVVRDGRLHRAWRQGVTSGAETLEDVAWVSAGLLELFLADADTEWLSAALELVDRRLPHYLGESGELFDVPDDGEPLPARPRGAADGAIPSAVAIMAETLLGLAAVTERSALGEIARSAIRAEAATLTAIPQGCTALLDAAAQAARPPVEVVIVGDPDQPALRELVRAARRARRAPDVVVVSPACPVPADVAAAVPLFAGRETAPRHEARAYVCHGGSCSTPTSDASELARQLDRS